MGLPAAKAMDLETLAVVGGRERTRAEYEAFLDKDLFIVIVPGSRTAGRAWCRLTTGLATKKAAKVRPRVGLLLFYAKA